MDVGCAALANIAGDGRGRVLRHGSAIAHHDILSNSLSGNRRKNLKIQLSVSVVEMAQRFVLRVGFFPWACRNKAQVLIDYRLLPGSVSFIDCLPLHEEINFPSAGHCGRITLKVQTNQTLGSLRAEG
jgi:hypothetical protein